MKIYKYKDYNDYITEQIIANKKKIKNVWVSDGTIHKIFTKHGSAHNILCHGTRNGKEQELFNKYFPEANIIGTEISDTATQFKNTIQHDFHEIKREWINKFDIVYSNSWDHSYDPEKSLETWMGQLNENGKLYLEQALDPSDNESRKSDPLEIYHDEILDILNNVGLILVDSFNSTGFGTHPCKIYISKKQH
jgi:hypothetical protein